MKVGTIFELGGIEMSSLGKRIREIRNLRGLTQEKLAEKCSVSSACVSRWETSNLIPTRAHQEKIAMALEIQLGDLYIASEVGLPPNIIIKEIIETLSKMSLQEQQHILEYIQLFEKFRSLNKL